MAFAREATAVAAYCAVFAQHSMARDHDAQRIPACGRSCGTDCLWPPGALCELAVSDGFTEWDFCDFHPDTFLEISSVRTCWEGERGSFPCEIFLKFLRGFFEDGMVGVERPRFVRGRKMFALREVEADQFGFVRGHHQVAHRCF